MKLITFTVPCYNSAEYMHICIESLLKGGDKVEIVIVNDGSKDNTGEIADRYKEKYPDIIKVVHRKTAATAKASTRASATPPASTLRWWTPMTGWAKKP